MGERMRISFLFRTVFSLILLVVITITELVYFNQKLKNKYIQIADYQTELVVSKLVNQVVLDVSKNENDILLKNEEFISYDINKINQLVSNVSSELVYVMDCFNSSNYGSVISEDFRGKHDTNSIVYNIPFSLVSDNVLLNFIGPNIPVRINLLGNVLTSSFYKVEEFGINNALITLFIKATFKIGMMLPLVSEQKEVVIDVPINMNIIEGKVPSYMFGTHQLGG